MVGRAIRRLRRGKKNCFRLIGYNGRQSHTMGLNKNTKTANKNANKKTLQEWSHRLTKLYNAMADANRQGKLARREKISKEYFEATINARQQHGHEAVKGLMGVGVTLNTISKEEYEERQKKNNTQERTFYEYN